MSFGLLCHQERGTGMPLVLLHGFPLDHRVFEPQLNELSKDFRVITPDLCGFGKSKSPSAFSMDSQAEDVHRLLVQLDALPCVLAGLSMGGYVALSYWKKFPATLKGLIFIDTRAHGDDTEGKKGRERMAELAKREGSKAIAEQMLPKMVLPGSPLTQRMRELMESCDPAAIANACIAMRDREDHTCELPSIGVPALVVVGEKDPIIPQEIAKKMAETMPQGKLVVVPNAAHMAQLEQPEMVNGAIREFMHTIHR